MSNSKPKSPLANHHWLHAELVRDGYNTEAASNIAFRFLTGKTLFVQEHDDAAEAMKRVLEPRRHVAPLPKGE